MGASDEDEIAEAMAKNDLTKQAMKLNLGFPESQVRHAIDELVTVYGSIKEAYAWIPQENFTVLVEYILDNIDEIQCLQTPQACAAISESRVAIVRESDKKLAKRRSAKKSSNTSDLAKNRSDSTIVDAKPIHAHGDVHMVHDDKTKRYIGCKPRMASLCREAVRSHFREKIPSSLKKLDVSRAPTLPAIEVQARDGIQRRQVDRMQFLLTPDAEVTNENVKDDHGCFLLENEKGFCIGNAQIGQLDSSERIVKPFLHKKQESTGAPRSMTWAGKSARLLESLPKCSVEEEERSDHKQKGSLLSLEASPQLNMEGRSTLIGGCEHVASSSQRKCGDSESRVLEKTLARVQGKEDCGFGKKENNKEARLTVEIDMEDHGSVGTSQIQGLEPSSCKATLVAAKEAYSSRTSLLEQLERCLGEGDCMKALEAFSAWNRALYVETRELEERDYSSEGERDKHKMVPDVLGKNKGWVVSHDVSRGLEYMPITCVNEHNSDVLPQDFLYITHSVITADAYVEVSFNRIGDLHCNCSDDCLQLSEACRCTDSTRGEYAYDEIGRLIPRLATSFQSRYGTENGDFITECWAKCHCNRQCGNRVVQRGIRKKLQVFMTPSKKGWGVRALEKVPAHSFVFEYVGEIVTNEEQYFRNIEHEKRGVHTYTMNLDADFDMEQRHFKEGLTDNEALVLDATNFGNVSRFVNHRCFDANLFIRPVQIETRDTHYYHAAFFAVRDIEVMEELTWDYGIDFNDNTHSVKAFKCHCNSPLCRDKSKKRKLCKALVVK